MIFYDTYNPRHVTYHFHVKRSHGTPARDAFPSLALRKQVTFITLILIWHMKGEIGGERSNLSALIMERLSMTRGKMMGDIHKCYGVRSLIEMALTISTALPITGTGNRA